MINNNNNNNNEDLVELDNQIIKPQLTNEQKLEYLSRLIKKADKKYEEKVAIKKLTKKENN